jgi:hypothetical protein
MLGGPTFRNWILSRAWALGYNLANAVTNYVQNDALGLPPNEYGTAVGAACALVKRAIGQRVIGGP